jgi:hypothetical protein
MASLLQWRGALVSSVIALQVITFHVLLWRGGACRKVVVDLLAHYQANCLMYYGFNHMLQPLLFRYGLLAAAAHAGVLIVLAHLWWLPPALLGWTMMQRTALYCCVFVGHMVLSCRLEYAMQVKFLQAAAEPRT